ncbi:MAG: transporter substrate-binding domain-containing protein [Desulfobulbus sp.]
MIPSFKTIPIAFRVSILCILLALGHAPWFHVHAAAPEGKPAHALRVVMDNNYPPYVFVNNGGEVQGILADQWRLWQEKTGIQVEITATDWKAALLDMKAGKYDVIDTAFETEERKTWLDFGKPHTRIEVAAYFDKEISAINTIDSLRGFVVAAKEGDANVNLLRSHGVDNLVFFKRYEDVVLAAKERKINVFVADAPPALYFLYKYGLQNDFKRSQPIQVGEFHRAVKKGNLALLREIETGFALLTPGELAGIEKKWLGSSLRTRVSRTEILIGGGCLGLVLLLFFFLNRSLRAAVRKRTAELESSRGALQQERQRLQCVIDGSRLGVWEWNVQTNKLVLNETWAELIGYTLEELTPYDYATWEKLLHPDDVERARDTLSLCVDGKTSNYNCEIRMRHKAGHWVWILDRGQIFTRDAAGNPLSMFGTHTDISTIKRAEEDARDTSELLSQFIKNSPIYTYIKEVTPSESRTLKASDNWQDMIGLSAAEMLGKTMDEIFPTEFASQITADDWQVVSRGEILKREEILEGRTYTTIKFPIRLGDKSLLAGYTIDLTDRVQAEEEREKLREQLIQSQKMESVGRLAGGVAHDFNNMLSVIIGHCELALRGLESKHPLYAGLRNILKAAEHSADLTRNLLAFARKQTVAPKVLDINTTMEGMLEMLRRLMGEGIDLVWKPSDLGYVYIDPSQLNQIFVNLFVNARDAIGDTGKVTIETDLVTIDERYCADHAEVVAGTYVQLAVSDDGCGIEKATLPHLFEPFFTTKEMGKGTGLGLATVYGIVKQNKGFINVYSEPDQGTTFKIYLPYHEPDPELAIESASDQAARGSEIVLVVEDEPMILEMATTMLESLGYAVLGASGPAEAIRLAHEHGSTIQLLMTDVVMPEMNGRVLANQLRALFPGLRCLFMSGYTANVIAHHGVLDEGMHFIQKPFTIHTLAAKIREALGAGGRVEQER